MTGNASSNATDEAYSLAQMLVMGTGVSLLCLFTVVGNLLVCWTMARDPKQRDQAQNWFLVSLAVADLLVGAIIVPFNLVREMLGYWPLGLVVCELWLATDVLLCTASIVSLCAISIDRFLSITYPVRYANQISRRRAVLYMLATIWVLSVVVGLPPLVDGWMHSTWSYSTSTRRPQCEAYKKPGFVVYSALFSFFIPSLVILVFNARIYSVARSKAQRSRQSYNAMREVARSSVCEESHGFPSRVASESTRRSVEDAESTSERYEMGSPTLLKSARLHRNQARKRERRATLVIGLVIVAFFLCWGPFFVCYVLQAYMPVDARLFGGFNWWGYCNSCLNPVIYTVFNRSFRKALGQSLPCR